MSDTIKAVINGTALIPVVVPTTLAELAGLFDPLSEGSLSAVERDLLTALLKQNERIDVAIPEDITDNALWDALALCCKVESRVKKVQGVLKMLIGRALVLLQKRPQMYRALGFRTLDDLMSDSERGLPALTGISRAELYVAKDIGVAFPAIQMSEFREIGFNKLATISKVVKAKDSNAQEWLDRAKVETIKELKESIYKSDNGIEPGSLDYDTVIFTVTKDQKRRIEEFLVKPETQAVCGTGFAGEILCRMIEECDLEWIVRARAFENQGQQ
jgi:hypothetical protein